MFVLLIGADGVEALHTEDANDGAKDVRLLKINVYELRRLYFDVLDRLCDMICF